MQIIHYIVWYSRVYCPTRQSIGHFGDGGRLSSDVHPHSVMDIITPLTHVAFVYNGPKGMELARDPRYSGGSKSSRRLI